MNKFTLAVMLWVGIFMVVYGAVKLTVIFNDPAKQQAAKEKAALSLCFLYGYNREGHVIKLDQNKDTLTVKCEGDRF